MRFGILFGGGTFCRVTRLVSRSFAPQTALVRTSQRVMDAGPIKTTGGLFALHEVTV